jgi:hypothetical protein
MERLGVHANEVFPAHSFTGRVVLRVKHPPVVRASIERQGYELENATGAFARMTARRSWDDGLGNLRAAETLA